MARMVQSHANLICTRITASIEACCGGAAWLDVTVCDDKFLASGGVTVNMKSAGSAGLFRVMGAGPDIADSIFIGRVGRIQESLDCFKQGGDLAVVLLYLPSEVMV